MIVSKDESAYQAACCVCCVVSGCVRICAARVAKERVGTHSGNYGLHSQVVPSLGYKVYNL